MNTKGLAWLFMMHTICLHAADRQRLVPIMTHPNKMEHIRLQATQPSTSQALSIKSSDAKQEVISDEERTQLMALLQTLFPSDLVPLVLDYHHKSGWIMEKAFYSPERPISMAFFTSNDNALGLQVGSGRKRADIPDIKTHNQTLRLNNGKIDGSRYRAHLQMEAYLRARNNGLPSSLTKVMDKLTDITAVHNTPTLQFLGTSNGLIYVVNKKTKVISAIIYTGKDPISSLDSSPEGDHLVSVSGNNVKVWKYRQKGIKSSKQDQGASSSPESQELVKKWYQYCCWPW